MSIQILDPDVVDQIAAGEVVERPAHLVKELVENSIDAGATELEIEFDHGGRRVKVVDNGCGIPREELHLALSRHATSKIQASGDLWGLKSFGFRGEALASISSVCELTLISKTEKEDSAYQLHAKFGKVLKPEACGGSLGTTILVEDLFSNVPARLKFLKSDAAESTQIKNVLKAMAMVYPKVSFRIRHKSKLLYYWPSTENLVERVEQVLEQERMFYGEAEYEGVRAKVVVASPNVTTGNSRQIWMYAQKRWVQDGSLRAAVRQAYRSLLMHGEFPIAVAQVECDPEDIDVNIHPTKSQVKFRQASHAFRAVHYAVRECLEKAPWLEDLIPQTDDPHRSEAKSYDSSLNLSDIVAKEPVAQSFQGSSFDQVQFAQRNFKPQERPSTSSMSVVEQLENLKPMESDFSEPVEAIQVGDSALGKSTHWSRLQVLGQANLTYIIAQSEQSIVFVDQHAAHERVVYEKLMKNFEQGQFEVQNSLIPETVELGEENVDVLCSRLEELEKMGLYLDQMSPTTLAVNAHPALIKAGSLKAVLEKMSNEIIEKGDSFALEMVIRDLFATMACHSVVRAGAILSTEQMKSLLVQMDEFPLSSFCPHGRPVYVEYPFVKLEKDFGRIV